MLPENNANKLGEKLRASILKAKCYGRAKYLAKSITLEKLNADSLAQYIVNAIQKRDPISVVSEVFTDFKGLLSRRRYTSENINDFEFRFSARLSRFKAHGTGEVPDSFL